MVLVGQGLFVVTAVLLVAPSGAGTYADWVVAVATVLALAFAAAAAVATYRSLKIEQRRDSDRLRQQRRAQAEQISAWVSDAATANGPDGALLGIAGFTVSLVNVSDLPVFRVEGQAYHERPDGSRDPHWTFSATVLGPTGVTPKTHSIAFDGWFLLSHFGVEEPQHVLQQLQVDLTFTDQRGRAWTRRGDGRLGPVPQATEGPPASTT